MKSKESKPWQFGIPILFFLLITGCEKGGRILGGSFSDNHLFLNTELDKKLKYDISTHSSCFKLPPRNILDESAIERFTSSRMRIFYELFPQGTPAITVLNTLKGSGAQCQIENNHEIDLTHCSLIKEWIYGIKELHIFGWRIHRAYLTKSSFEYSFTTQEDHILTVSVNSISCETYEIDKDLYEESKAIKPIRRLQ
jgi:hypothetical protein